MSERTPGPWIFDSEGIISTDRNSDCTVIARCPNHPDNAKHWQPNAAFIVRAVNNFDALVSALEDVLRCGNAIVTASFDDPQAQEAFDMYDAARRQAREILARSKS